MELTTLRGARAMLLRLHYRLMENPRFWYQRELIDASRIFCVAASDLRIEIEKEDGR